MMKNCLLLALSPFLLFPASCSVAASGDKASPRLPFEVQEMGRFDEPWALAFDKGTGTLFITERKGRIRFREPSGKVGEVSGVPPVDYGGQGGLGDFIFAPGQRSTTLDRRIVYLSWAEAGTGDTRGAAVGRAQLVCTPEASCSLQGLKVIWRQSLKVTGSGHYSHRLAFSPDGKYLFVASGDRQKMQPAQDLTNNLGTIVRLLPDGTPAPGNPFADKGTPTDQIWSYGHRNILGLAFDASERLWDLEHGPAGGDELNLVVHGENYGWPVVSEGNHYSGEAIPRHSSRPEFAAPALSWNPVIAPGGMIIYSGDLFPDWKGEAIIGAMKPGALVRVRFDADMAKEIARYPMKNRIRAVAQAPDGAIWIVEDGKEVTSSRLLRLTPTHR